MILVGNSGVETQQKKHCAPAQHHTRARKHKNIKRGTLALPLDIQAAQQQDKSKNVWEESLSAALTH